MKKITLFIGLALALVLPAGAIAKPHPDNADKRAAKKECKALNLHGRAFGKCVSEKAKAKEHAADEQDAEDAAEFKNAAKECDSERTADATKFATDYGTNENDRNAFGKCVSSKVSDDEEETETS